MKKRFVIAIILLILAGARETAASPLLFTLVSPVLTTTPGTNVTFAATLENPTAADEFLNGDSFTAALAVDDSPFFLNFPAVLGAGASLTADIFTVFVPVATPTGLYAGVFTVLGGPTGGDLDVLATQAFTVDVRAVQPAAVPEPATLSLVSLGAVALLRGVRSRRRTAR